LGRELKKTTEFMAFFQIRIKLATHWMIWYSATSLF